MIYLDFDGTIIDLWPRYYNVFCHLNGTVDFKSYKFFKQKLKKDELVAKALNVSLCDKYFEKKKLLLEDKSYLELDKIVISENDLRILYSLDATILTKRRNETNFIWQLEKLGIKLPYVVLDDSTSKYEYVLDNCTDKGIIVGDSIQDLLVGKEENILAIMVSYGLNTIDDFNKEGIDYLLCNSPKDLVKLIFEEARL